MPGKRSAKCAARKTSFDMKGALALTAFRMACALKVRIVSSTSQTYMTLFPAFCSQSQAMYHRLSTTIDHSNHRTRRLCYSHRFIHTKIR